MIKVHPSAEVSDRTQVGDGTQIWHQAQVREGAKVSRNCVLGKGVYVDFDVQIGDNCKLKNGAFVYHGAMLEDGVFVGPGAILTNDRLPRAINPDGSLKAEANWEVGRINVRRGASLGAVGVYSAGVADSDLARAREIAIRYNVPANADYLELLGHVDPVSVAAPTTLPHYFGLARLMLEEHLVGKSWRSSETVTNCI